jgi:hypothetical protein
VHHFSVYGNAQLLASIQKNDSGSGALFLRYGIAQPFSSVSEWNTLCLVHHFSVYGIAQILGSIENI